MYSCVMHKKAITLATLALIAGLTGCAGGTADAGVQEPVVEVTGQAGIVVEESPTAEPAPTPTETAAPVEIAQAEQAPELSPAEERLGSLHRTMNIWGVPMTLEQTRTAANYVCDELAKGIPKEEIVAITGVEDPKVTLGFNDSAAGGYCTLR